MKFATQSIHAAYNPEEHLRSIMPPIYQNTLFSMKHIGEDIPFRYSRLSNPTRQILEDTMAQLEHGFGGLAFSSGIAAIDTIFRTILRPGDTIVATEDLYGGTFDLLQEVYIPWGVKVIFADLRNVDNLEKILLRETVKLLWLETPSNPLLHITDTVKLSECAHKYGVYVGMDNTFATPYFQNPLLQGCDVVAHSATKYLCGHSDVLMGIVVAKNKEDFNKLRSMQVHTGAIASPMDCAFVLRGIKTLTIRMDKHQENAQIIAERLTQHSAIEKVFYPGLPNHEGHKIACEQMSGFGGVVSVYLKSNTREAANTLISNLKIIQLASSLGGVESLINHSFTQSHSGMSKEIKEKLGIKEGLLRFSIGIEDVEDIWEDITQALSKIK
ncbi:MAG: PLP-dependent transferase [Neisseriaceae bacterium]|nr:PLP-dependent transferase [Neisseriaceae bacterium]